MKKEKYLKFGLNTDAYKHVRTFKEYKQMLEHDPFEYIKYRCLKEMYERAQPSVNLDDLLKEHFNRLKQGLEAEQFYDRYFLSYEECKYVLDKYVHHWYLEDPWERYLDLIINDAQEKHIRDKWIPERIDEFGNTHPGYSGYEDVPPLKEIIGEDAANKVVAFLNERKNFYRRNIDENAFRAQICLGISPSSNDESVKRYWKEKGCNLDIDLRKHGADYFWCEENGYWDDLDEIKEREEKERKEKKKEKENES